MSINNQINISNQVISMGKEYVTRKGEKVRVLCTDNYGNAAYPVVAITNGGDIYSFKENGSYLDVEEPSDYDLIDIWTYKKSQFKEGDILIVGVFKDTMIICEYLVILMNMGVAAVVLTVVVCKVVM